MGIINKVFSILKPNKTILFSDDRLSNTIKQPNNYKTIVLDEEPNLVKAVFLERYKNKDIETKYPAYFKYRYSIDEPMKLHQEFIQQGFFIEIKFEDNKPLILNKLRNEELKQLLRSKGLKVSGNKSELIEKLIIAGLSKSEIHHLPHIYTLSEKAKRYLERYDFLYQLHLNNYEIQLEEYLHVKNKLEKKHNIKNIPFNDVADAVIKQRIIKHYAHKDYGLLFGDYLNLYRLTSNLQYLCNAIFLVLAGVSNNNTVEQLDTLLLNNNPISPGFSKELKSYKLDDIIQKMNNVNLELPFQYFSIKQMIDIIVDDYNDIPHNIEILKSIAKKPNEKSKAYRFHDLSDFDFLDDDYEEDFD